MDSSSVVTRAGLVLLGATIFALTMLLAAPAWSQDVTTAVAGKPSEALGPLAGERVTVEDNGTKQGVIDKGDVLTIEGDFQVSSGASVILEDGNHTTNKGTGDKDNTQGTFADEQNAEIREGSVVITVTDDPIGAVPVVEGEDGQLSTNGVEVVTSSGIQPAGNDSNTGDTVVVIINGLPDGGPGGPPFPPDGPPFPPDGPPFPPGEGPPFPPEGDICSNFDTQEQAQAAFDSGLGRPEIRALLDPDDDDVACEELADDSGDENQNNNGDETTGGTTGGTTGETTTGTAGQADEGCASPQLVETFEGTESQRTGTFAITGNTIRIGFETTVTDPDTIDDNLVVRVLDEDGGFVDSVLILEPSSGSENILAGPGTFSLEIEAGNVEYTVTVEDCGGAGGSTGPSTDPDNQRVVGKQGNVVNEVSTNRPLPNTGGGGGEVATGTVLAMVLFGVALLALRLVASWRTRRA